MSVETRSDPLSTSERVLREVASEEGVDPIDLATPLYDVIDPDALDTLFAADTSGDEQGSIQVEFNYHGYEIVVSDGTVRLTPSE